MRRRRVVVYYEPDNRPDLRRFALGERRYTAWNFGLDLFLTVLTSGIWLIWIFIREMRG